MAGVYEGVRLVGPTQSSAEPPLSLHKIERTFSASAETSCYHVFEDIMDYWEECISIAADECGLKLTKDQLECLAGSVECGHENYGMAFGHDCIPNPMNAEVESLKKRIRELEDKHERCLYGIKNGVALRRNVSVSDVHIESDGHVTYDRR